MLKTVFKGLQLKESYFPASSYWNNITAVMHITLILIRKEHPAPKINWLGCLAG